MPDIDYPNAPPPFAPHIEAAIRAIVQEEISIVLARMRERRIVAVPVAPAAEPEIPGEPQE